MKLMTKSAVVIFMAGLLSGCASGHDYFYPSTGYYTPSRMAPYPDSPSYASAYSCGNYKASYGYHHVVYKDKNGYCCKHGKHWKPSSPPL